MRRQLAHPIVVTLRPGARPSDLFIWLLLLLPLTQSLLLWTIPDASASSVTPIRLIRPVATLGAGLLFLMAAAREIGMRRWTWHCFALMQMIHTTASVLTHVVPEVRSGAAIGYGSLIQLLSFAMYGAALLGAALYLYQHEHWVGNAGRVVLDAMALALALLVLLQSVLPSVLGVGQLPNPIAEALPYLAADGGVLFAVLVVALRYGRTQQPLVVLISLGLACLIIADAIDLWLTLKPSAAGWRFATSPLYALQGVLMAIGAYWNVRQVPATPRSTKASAAEWWLWTLSPSAVSLVALATAALTGAGGRGAISLLCLVALVQVVLALRALRQVEISFETALAREQEARYVIQFFQHELRSYADGLRGIGQLLHQQASGRPLRDEQRTQRTLDVLATTVEQLDELIQQLVLLGRATNPPEIRNERIALHVLVSEALAMTLGPGGRRIWHTVEVDEEIAVRGDPLLLRLALRTALQNSIEASGRVHSGRNLQIRVQAQADQQRVWIRVEDTGPGFPEAVLQAFANGRLADLRSVSAARVRGIGLALLEQIALLHEGGKLTLGNREGNTGAWVQLDLPRWNEDTPPANRATLDEPIPRL